VRFSATGGAYGYADAEVNTNPGIGSQYFNVISNVNRQWTGTVWQNAGGTGGSGTVTSVVDGSGLFSVANPTTVPTFTYTAVPANTFLRGPSSGGNAAPFFGVIGVSDLPSTTLSAAGTPTVNAITKWVTSNTIGNSNLNETTGTSILVGNGTGGIANATSSNLSSALGYTPSALIGPNTGTSIWYFSNDVTSIDTVQGYITFWIPTASSGIQAVFGNASQTPEVPGPQMTIRAALEYPEGTFNPIYFRGSRDAVLDGGGILTSDPVNVDIPANKIGFIRYRAIRSPGQTVGIPAGWSFGYFSGSTILAPNTTTKVGARFDGVEDLQTRTVTDGAITSGAAVFTSATAAFVPQDAGQNITVNGAGAAGANLATTILTYTNATTVTLAVNASTTVSGATTAIVPADKTTQGAIYNAAGTIFDYAPLAILGKPTGLLKNACLGIDSITFGQGGSRTAGSWAVQALNQAGVAAGLGTNIATGIPYYNFSNSGEQIANLIVHHNSRFALIPSCKYVLGMAGTNDIVGYTTAQIEANFTTMVTDFRQRGSLSYFGTIIPETNSTDNWATLANQSVRATEAIRVAVNNWMRDGSPLDPTTKLPVAVGTVGAIRCAYYSSTGVLVNAASGPSLHPAAAIFDLADSVETARNSGLWIVPAGGRTVTDAAMTAGSAVLTSATANFTAGDVGHSVVVSGAGTGGVFLNAAVSTFTSATQVSLSTVAITTVSGAQTTISGTNFINYTVDGTHPTIQGHAVMGVSGGAVVATWQ